MKSSLFLKSSLLILVMIVATGAFAGGAANKASFQISSPVQVHGTQLPAGDYIAQWEGTGPEVQVSLIRAGKVVATVPAQLVQLTQKADRDRADMKTGANGAQELTALQFNGKKVALSLSGDTETKQAKSEPSRSE